MKIKLSRVIVNREGQFEIFGFNKPKVIKKNLPVFSVDKSL